jgi:hypothetical protein
MKEGDRFTQASTQRRVALLAMEGSGHLLEPNYYPPGNKFDKDYEVGEGLDRLGFKVKDLEAVVPEAKWAGYPPPLEMQKPAQRWANIRDPNGTWVEFFVPPS